MRSSHDRARGNHRRGSAPISDCATGVEHPDQVELEIEESDTKLSLMAKVSSEDIGRTGKRGRAANSIRTLVRAAAVKDGVDVEVDFSD